MQIQGTVTCGFWDRRVNENAHTGMRMDGIDTDLCRDRRMGRDAIT